jgi:filamentous hemagglutinin family protein
VGNFDVGASGARTFEVTATDGSLDINSGKLTVAGVTGNTAIAGTLDVAGT